MSEYPKAPPFLFENTDKTVLWDLHVELTELLYEAYEDFYIDCIYYYSQRFDQLMTNLREAISQCEELERFKDLIPDRPDWYGLKTLYSGYGNMWTQIAFEGSDVQKMDTRSGCLPTDYTTNCVSIPGDAILWQNRWEGRIKRYQSMVQHARKELEPKMSETFTPVEKEKLQMIYSYYRGVLQHLKDLNQYSDPHGMSFDEYQGSYVLERRLKYYPQTSDVFLGRTKVVSPTRLTQHWLVWNLLFACKKRPRRAYFKELKEFKNDGKHVFPKISDSITRSISKWDASFKEHGVSVLHYEKDAILLRVDDLKKRGSKKGVRKD